MMDSSDVSRPTDNGKSPPGLRRHFVLANASFVPVVLTLSWFLLVPAVFGRYRERLRGHAHSRSEGVDRGHSHWFQIEEFVEK